MNEKIALLSHKFYEAGIAVIPIRYKDKRPEFKLLPKSNTDCKPTWEVYKTRLPTEHEFAHWFGHQINYGVVVGWQGLLVLDFDSATEYHEWLLWATVQGGIAQYVAESAYRVSTSRGIHVYVRIDHRERNRKVGNIDIKADGYVLGPGSVHPSGAEYKPLRESFNFPVISALSDVLPATMLFCPTSGPNPANSISGSVWTVTPNTTPRSDLIKKIRAANPIESFFPTAKPSGPGWLMANCPFHDDQHPSFWINTRKQICGCFAGCTPLPLDSINLFARLHGLNNRDAIFVLSGR